MQHNRAISESAIDFMKKADIRITTLDLTPDASTSVQIENNEELPEPQLPTSSKVSPLSSTNQQPPQPPILPQTEERMLFVTNFK